MESENPQARPADKDLRSKVADWLMTQGYPLEMQVAAAFLKAGLKAVQAEYYDDPETEIPREIDVVAFAEDAFDSYRLRLTVCIECKVTKEKPWVLLTSAASSLPAKARVTQRAASLTGLRFLESVSQDKLYQNLRLFRLPPRPAYGLIQAFTTGNDAAYAACMSAAKATAALVGQANAENEGRSDIPFARRVIQVVIPAIVIDGRLFECFLNENGETVVDELKEGTLVWRNPLVQMPHTIIRVVTLHSLPQLIEDVTDAWGLFRNSDNEIRRLFAPRDRFRTD